MFLEPFFTVEANHGQRQRVEPRHRDVQVQREGDAPRVQVGGWSRCSGLN